MNINELEEYSKKTKGQADKLLQSTKMLDILKKFGDVHIVGSYSMDVMYGPDIDILVETNNIKEKSRSALQEIVDTEIFRKVEYGDFVKFPMKNRPSGYILILKAEVENVKWEIEVWFLPNVSKQLSEYKQLKSRITADNRIKILKAKHLRGISNLDKHKLKSFEIYEQILGKIAD